MFALIFDKLFGAGVFLTPSEDSVEICLPFSDLSVSDDPPRDLTSNSSKLLGSLIMIWEFPLLKGFRRDHQV